MEALISRLSELTEFSKTLIEGNPGNRIFLLKGKMGAGKTTLMRYIGDQLGSKDKIASPTFSVINEYQCAMGIIAHIDLYRIETLMEARQLGIEEYITGDSYCFIEWPNLIEEILPKPFVSVNLEECTNGDRLIRVEHYGKEKTD